MAVVIVYYAGMAKLVDNIVCGDCIKLLGKVAEPFADLIFADPPFNIGYKYDKYKDKVKGSKYVVWTGDWMRACVDVLKPGGSFYVAIGDDHAAHVRLIGEELGLTLRNWIVWHYTFGQQTKKKFARAHAHIFYFVKDSKNFTFNDHAVRVPSDRQLIYNDKRANPRGKMPDDVWGEFSRVCGTFNEREGWHPCQMPESILMRIIAVSSNPGDVVFDPFAGSGTTAAAACLLGRKYSGMDISADYVKNMKKRLGEIKKQVRNYETLFVSFDAREVLELRRLFLEMGLSCGELLASKKLLGVFTRQFEVRMNNGKEYDDKDVAMVLMEVSRGDSS